MHLARELRGRIDFFRRQAVQFSFAGAVKLRLINKYNELAVRSKALPHFWPIIRVRLPGFKHNMYLRTGTSDMDVFRQVFVDREYESVHPRETVETILDCGANVGYTSVYFLNKYPDARVVAVEPDPENARICRMNLAPYGDRAQVVVGAVWSHPATLTLVQNAYRDGRAWATQVRQMDPERDCAETSLTAFDIPALMHRLGCDQVDILKVDIERSEAILFGGACQWLKHVKNIAIELHDAECERIFFSAMQPYRFDLEGSGELTICRNIQLPGERLAPLSTGLLFERLQ
jgi:FkbM family methyltransferase